MDESIKNECTVPNKSLANNYMRLCNYEKRYCSNDRFHFRHEPLGFGFDKSEKMCSLLNAHQLLLRTKQCAAILYICILYFYYQMINTNHLNPLQMTQYTIYSTLEFEKIACLIRLASKEKNVFKLRSHRFSSTSKESHAQLRFSGGQRLGKCHTARTNTDRMPLTVKTNRIE